MIDAEAIVTVVDYCEKIDLPRPKRAFDIVFSLFLLVVTAPVFATITLLILVEQIAIPASRGSVLYRETRVSQGKPFSFLKFRTFKKSVLDTTRREKGIVHTKDLEKDRENFTLCGWFLNKVYMDELPQLVNILKGDMTFVGPRPTNPNRDAELTRLGCNSKWIMKCGLTGPYQAGKGTVRPSDYDMDMEYIDFVKRHSGWAVLRKDVSVLCQTIHTVLRAQGE